MQEVIKDWFQIVGGTITIIGGGIASFKAIHEIRENRKQRQIEFHWKRVNAAKELCTDIHKNEFASQAVTMLDWYNAHHDYKLPSGDWKSITWDIVLSALSKKQESCEGDIDIFVRDCFDWLFYLIDRVEHYISAHLIERSDVETVFYPYAHILDSHWGIFSEFMKSHHYILAEHFFERLIDSHSKIAIDTQRLKRGMRKQPVDKLRL